MMNRITLLVILVLLLGSSACKRNPSTPNPVTPVNDNEQVTANVSGIITDENNKPLGGVTVTSGTASTVTNLLGIFRFEQIPLSKANGHIRAGKTGYFTGVRSFKSIAGKTNQVRLQLIKKVLSGTVNAASGGTINSAGGASIVFPAAAFETMGGTPYTGNVAVYCKWIDPTAANLPYLMPGDLRGVGTDGAEKIMETYGMIGAELEDISGNPLKIAAGKTATITVPIPSVISSQAPASIPLWHFDNASARWKEEGTGTKNGNTYTAQVNKFSFWNFDISLPDAVNLSYTLIDNINNSPLASVTTRLKRVSSGNYGYGLTNGSGYVSGAVPKNEPLVLEVLSPAGTVIYSQNTGPFQVNTDLGNIAVPITASQVIHFSGTLVNCSNTPVTSGTITLSMANGYSTTVSVNPATGAFTASCINTTGLPANFNYYTTDISTGLQSIISTGTATSGTVNMGTIPACGTIPTNEFIHYTVNGNTVSFNAPGDVLTFTPDPSADFYTIMGTSAGKSVAFEIRDLYLNYPVFYPDPTNPYNIVQGSLYSNPGAGINWILRAGSGSQISYTEFSPVAGGYIAGSGTFTINSTSQTVNFSFRIKRT